MTTSLTLEELEQQVLALSAKDRARLADKLWGSLEDADLELSEEWRVEIERRCRDLDEGRVKAVPGEQVLMEARARLAKLRDR